MNCQDKNTKFYNKGGVELGASNNRANGNVRRQELSDAGIGYVLYAEETETFSGIRRNSSERARPSFDDGRSSRPAANLTNNSSNGPQTVTDDSHRDGRPGRQPQVRLPTFQPNVVTEEDEPRTLRSPMVLPDILETAEDDDRRKGFRVFLHRKFNPQVWRGRCSCFREEEGTHIYGKRYSLCLSGHH